MTRLIKLETGLLTAVTVSLAGQAVEPRSADYLFTTTVDDVRSLWVNPAGLGIVEETSVMADLVFERATDASQRLSQWTIGFNARGLSVGFQRDRLASDSANQALRMGVSRGFPGGAIGVAMTHYGSGMSDQGWDVGVRLLPYRSLALALLLENVGRPQVRGQPRPIRATAGTAWGLLAGMLQLTADATLAERLARDGYDASYKAGVRLSTPVPVPLSAFGVAQMDEHLGVLGWTFGVAIGHYRRGIVVGTLRPRDDARSSDLLSFHGLATNRGARLSQP